MAVQVVRDAGVGELLHRTGRRLLAITLLLAVASPSYAFEPSTGLREACGTARSLEKSARGSLSKGRIREANWTLVKALDRLGYWAVPRNVLDDSDQKLALATAMEREGRGRNAAAIRFRTLRDRLSFCRD